MSSSTMKSSSPFARQNLDQHLCFCEVEAQVRYANTPNNQGRFFLGCPRYNIKGLLYCKYFKWVEKEDQYRMSDRQETNSELLSDIRELKKMLNDIERRVIDLRKRVTKMELVLSSRDSEFGREAERARTLFRPLYWALAFFVACYMVAYK